MDGHDNDANKNAQNSSASRQGIFSTPELTVNAENIAQQNNEETKSRVASIFANTDAGKQAQKLNDAMDAQTVPATEDLVIQNGPKKKSKLPIILLILVLVAAGVGGLVWVLMNNIKPQETVSSIEEAKRKFDNYATYILYGKSEDELNGDYSPVKTYTLIEKVQETDGFDESFWQTSEKLLKDSIEAYSKTEQPDKNLINYLNAQSGNLAFLSSYSRAQVLTDQSIISNYLSNGGEASKSYIEDSFIPFETIRESSPALDYIKRRQEQYSAVIDMLNFYNDNGCIVDQSLNEECASEVQANQADRLDSILKTVTEARQAADRIINQITAQTIQSCWQINMRFSGTIDDVDDNIENEGDSNEQ